MKLNNFIYLTSGAVLGGTRTSEGLPEIYASDFIIQQIGRCIMSAGNNMRAAEKARSRNKVVANLMSAKEEIEESFFWLGFLEEYSPEPDERIAMLRDEGAKLLAVVCDTIRAMSQGEA
jgi:four helix bundle protein